MRTVLRLSIVLFLIVRWAVPAADVLAADASAVEGPAAGAIGDEKEVFVVVRAGRVIPVAGPEIVDGQIVIVNGKIRLVGKDLEYPSSAKVIDARNEVVMPGWIHPRTRWQLPSYARSGIHADRSPAREIYWTELDCEPLLEAGYTTICFYPSGSGIPGPGEMYRTAGPEKDRKLGTAYLRVTMSQPGRDKKTFRAAIEKARQEIDKVEKARKEWEAKQKKEQEAKAKEDGAGQEDQPPADREEGKDPKKQNEKNETPADPKSGQDQPEAKKPATFEPPKIDPAVLPFVEWIRDKKGMPPLFEIASASDLRHLDDVLDQVPDMPGTRLFLDAGRSSDFHHVVEELGQREAMVLLEPSLGELPATVVYYHLPAELVRAGCTVALMPAADSAEELRQLRTRLAALVRTGLDREDALKGVTLHPAIVLGVEDRLGTLEKGKDADLVFFNGDPLAIGTRTTRVMTAGDLVWEAPEQP